MFDTKKFGIFLSSLRKKADMTQSEVAIKLNVTRQAVSHYECGDTFPDVSILVNIANLFNISLDELIRSGEPSTGEALILTNIATGVEITNNNNIKDIINLAPFLKPSLLEKRTTVASPHPHFSASSLIEIPIISFRFLVI